MWWWWWCLVAKSCLTLATQWMVVCRAPLFMGFLRQEFSTQGSSLRLLLWQVDSLPLNHLGDPTRVCNICIICSILFLFIYLFLFEVQLLYTGMSVSALQQSESAIHTYNSSFWISFPFRSPQSTNSSSLCYIYSSEPFVHS